MLPATRPIQRPADAKLLVIDAGGRISHWPRAKFVELLERGDLVVANDAATLPASLAGVHVRTGKAIEVRLAQRASLDPDDVREFVAVVFGEGDHHARTEDRPAPPELAPGDALQLGPLRAIVRRTVGHPRLVAFGFEGPIASIWSGLATHGRPIQYAYMEPTLALWDVWTPIAGFPAAFEPPSAGFVLDWHMISELRARDVGFATITHAAGVSSTGDPELDRRLPLDEAYRIPSATAEVIMRTREQGGRVIAIGTTVVRALESAAESSFVRPGDRIATLRIGPGTALHVVDAILSGTHEPGTSHYELLRAFTDDITLRRADRELEAHGYRTHEFGDSVFVVRTRPGSDVRIPASGGLVALTQAQASRPPSSPRCARWRTRGPRHPCTSRRHC
jgi:S-adenosylmethionine:tRNA ribosyltransferase-isomerase